MSGGTAERTLAAVAAQAPLLLVDGERRGSSDGAVVPDIDPYREEPVAQAPEATVADAELAVEAARRAFDETGWARDPVFRARCLWQLHAALDRHREELRALLVAETGCPVSMTRALQLDGPISDVAEYAHLAGAFEYERQLPRGGAPGERLHVREPVGVVTVISPYNYPMHSLAIKAVPALAAGCTVVVKPAPQTPWTAAEFGRLVTEETDIPPGVVNVITSTSVATAEALVGHRLVDMVTFTGSTQVGRAILHGAADTVKKTIMELGGKSPHLVLPGADLDAALRWNLNALFRHAGQGCTKLTRTLVPRERYEEAVAAAAAIAAEVPCGDPADERTLMGPLISERQRHTVLGYIEGALAEGARLVAGGQVPNRTGYFVEPTVLADVTPGSRVAQEEIFGPVATLIPYGDVDEGVRIANDTVFGLSAAVWGASGREALAVARRIRAGTTTINGTYWHASDTPFGGVKQSGVGREQGVVGFEEFLEHRVFGHPALEGM